MIGRNIMILSIINRYVLFFFYYKVRIQVINYIYKGAKIFHR